LLADRNVLNYFNFLSDFLIFNYTFVSMLMHLKQPTITQANAEVLQKETGTNTNGRKQAKMPIK